MHIFRIGRQRDAGDIGNASQREGVGAVVVSNPVDGKAQSMAIDDLHTVGGDRRGQRSAENRQVGSTDGAQIEAVGEAVVDRRRHDRHGGVRGQAGGQDLHFRSRCGRRALHGEGVIALAGQLKYADSVSSRRRDRVVERHIRAVDGRHQVVQRVIDFNAQGERVGGTVQAVT